MVHRKLNKTYSLLYDKQNIQGAYRNGNKTDDGETRLQNRP